jgi:hypothetical protein
MITRNQLIDAGWIRDTCGVWISPYNGELMSFEQAREEEQKQKDSGESDLN